MSETTTSTVPPAGEDAPGKSLTMADGYLNARNAEPTAGRPVTIDRFFRSLADAHGQREGEGRCYARAGTE